MSDENSKRISRRSLLAGAATAATIALLRTASGQTIQVGGGASGAPAAPAPPWSGRGNIQKVEVSTDAGKTWIPARLQEPILDKAHTAFRLLWHWDGQETEILSRAGDETGNIKADGRVLFKPEKWK